MGRVNISIHTPHAGSDDYLDNTTLDILQFQSTLPMRGVTVIQFLVLNMNRISIHTPHAGSDSVDTKADQPYRISIHTPHAGSDTRSWRTDTEFVISIHTPHTGSDSASVLPDGGAILFQSTLPMRGVTDVPKLFVRINRFQSTLPMRGVTAELCPDRICIKISIHTPHAGSDSLQAPARAEYKNFNPHSPCGE